MRTVNQDEHYMKLAIQMAASTKGQTSPNPSVGSVVVKNGEVIGMGAHLKAGEAHAEVHALNMAGERARGATIYVTLEPCSHYGRTPPCAEKIIQSGITRAVVATLDPNPKVVGRGVNMLQETGIEVETGVLNQEADDLNEVFYHWIQSKRPYVTLKTAMSMDGKIATSTGESQWITGEEARQDVHHYRHTHDAILVGVNTVIQDMPSLTTRRPQGGKNPIRVVLDTSLRTPADTPLIQNPEAPTWIIAGNGVEGEKLQRFASYDHVEVIQLSKSEVSIEETLQVLGEKGVTSLFVEGGAKVNDAFLRAGAVQQVVNYVAPKLIGGEASPTPIGGEGIAKLSDSMQLKVANVIQLGEDVKIVSKPISKG